MRPTDTPATVTRTYYVLVLGNTVAASLIWGINTIFLLDAGLSNLEAFAANGENLCREREMLSGRSLDAGESALPSLGFLTDGQDRFFFDLHRFHSQLGHAAFDAGKAANAPLLKALTVGVRARIALGGPPANGLDVIDAYRATVSALVA